MDYQKQTEYADFITKKIFPYVNTYFKPGVSFVDYLIAFYKTSQPDIRILPSPYCYEASFVESHKDNSLAFNPSSSDEVQMGRGIWQITYQFDKDLHAQFGVHCHENEVGKFESHLTALVAVHSMEDFERFSKITESFVKKTSAKPEFVGFTGA